MGTKVTDRNDHNFPTVIVTSMIPHEHTRFNSFSPEWEKQVSMKGIENERKENRKISETFSNVIDHNFRS